MKILIFFFLALLIGSCTISPTQDFSEKYKTEILDTEKAFATMAKETGIPEAFLFFADENARLLRNDSLIMGKSGLAEYYSIQNLENVDLSWTVDFVDVSSSGDLGYTYGKYNYAITDSRGNATAFKGIFHTIWKKQKDGSWKFVWD